MYVTDGSLPQNNQMPVPPVQVARRRRQMTHLGVAVARAKTAASSLPAPDSFQGISGPALLDSVARGQNRLQVSGAFLGQPVSAPGTVTGRGAVKVQTPNTPKSGVTVVPFMDVGATTIARPLCPPAGTGVSISGPTWGDAIVPGSNCLTGGAQWMQWIQKNPWLALGVAIAAGFALSSMRRK